MTDAERDQLAWRNYVVQWHLDQELPLDCGCDDDTPDHQLCPSSVAWADQHFAAWTDPILNGPEDPWNHNIWKAAWGHNATLIASASDYRLPMPPEGTSWLARRLLVGGRQVVELTLLKLGEHKTSTLARARMAADPTTIAARARRMVQEMAK